MYAGRVVEYAAVKDLFRNPMHPYTRGLLKSIPRSDQDSEELFTIEGTVPGLSEMPKGCRFANRCGQACERCRTEFPPEIEMENGHKVACWLYAKEENAAKSETSV